MRILLVTPMPPSPDAPGAIPRLLHAAVAGLRERHEVTLVTVAGPDPWELEAAGRLGADGLVAHVVRREEPATSRARWARRGRLAWRWGVRGLPWRTAWFLEPRVQELVDDLAGAHDVIAVEDNAMGVYRYPAGTPAVLTEHEVRRARRSRARAALARGALSRAAAEVDWGRWPRYERAVWSRFALVQAFTDRDAATIAEEVPALRGRVRVNPFGIVMPPPADRDAEVPGELLFVGNMTHHPNVDAAVWLGGEILPSIRRERPGARLSIAGAGPPPEVTSLASDVVSVLGWVRDLRPVVERAEVVVAPIRVGGGMRMKVLEAMALGKAVVTTPRGAEGLDVPGEAAPLVVAPDAAGLARATVDLLDDAERRRALGDRARAFVERHHGSRSYARRLEDVYSEAVSLAGASARASEPAG